MAKATEQFVSAEVQQFVCAICLDIPSPKTAREHTECAHLFCYSCIRTHQKSNGSCPMCKQPLKEKLRSIARDNKMVYRMMQQLVLRCDSYQKGCKDTLKWEEFERHKTVCQFEDAGCKWKCGHTAQRSSIEEHQAQCAQRDVKCAHCDENFKVVDEALHLGQLCAVCPTTSVKCEFEKYGCDATMQRVAVGEHNKERMEHHLLLVKEACNWKDFEFSLKLGEISPEFVCQGARWKLGYKIEQGETGVVLYLTSSPCRVVYVKGTVKILAKAGSWYTRDIEKNYSIVNNEVYSSWLWPVDVPSTERPTEEGYVSVTFKKVQHIQ